MTEPPPAPQPWSPSHHRPAVLVVGAGPTGLTAAHLLDSRGVRVLLVSTPGVRNAANLCWKLAEVLAGRACDALLDTYDTERRPHARAVIDLSVRLGRIVMTNSRSRARLRDLLVRIAMHTPPGRRYLTEMRYRPDSRVRSGAVVRLDSPHQSLVGTPLPQPRVLRAPRHEVTRLDDALGHATRVDVCLDDRAPRNRVGHTGIADADSCLDTLFAGLAGHFVPGRSKHPPSAINSPAKQGVLMVSARRSSLAFR